VSLLLALSVCVGAGVVGGVFFAFSSFVLPALGELPPAQGIAAMQRINVVVLNPVFLGVFIGTAVLSLLLAGVSIARWRVPGSPLLLGSAALYLAGAFGVTVAFNVPRNERLATVDASSAEGASGWAVYLREWALWNRVRMLASVAAAAAAGLALSSGPPA
jgi:uncharacterized membrane protein